MADLIVLDGSTFVVSELTGDMERGGHTGFFLEDTRHLSRWQLRVDGEPLQLLTGRTVDYYSARIVGTVAKRPIVVRRDRFVSDGFHEDVALENTSEDEQRVRVEVDFGADFADVMDAREGDAARGRVHAEPHARSVRLWAGRGTQRYETIITFLKPGKMTRRRMTFDVRLGPRATWKTCIDVTPVVARRKRVALLRCDSFGKPEPKMRVSVEDWLEQAPVLEGADESLARTYRQSLVDLASLRLRPTEAFKWAMPAGGVPWYMTVFGRDSLMASYEALPFQTHLAEATLEALADMQATAFDDFADAEPGKIMHELRRGPLSATGVIPRVYYGTHDATPLFLILLDEYERWTGDEALVRELEEPARAAVRWIEQFGDPDGDGYLEYRRRSRARSALNNHSWKDSDDSIRFASGRLARPPIATCEVQGYAYDARLRTARLARRFWDDRGLAARLEEDAAALKERFNRDFWHPRRRVFVLALDGDKQQVDATASNMGHLLWSGIVDERKAAAVVRRLLRDDLFGGWGIRTLSTDNPGYDPLGYHIGCVWPHDTAIAAEGMRRYGFRKEAARLAHALLDAAAAFEHRLPEVFAGTERDASGVPVPYPDALSPQAWAAGAPLLALRTLLELDRPRRVLRVSARRRPARRALRRRAR